MTTSSSTARNGGQREHVSECVVTAVAEAKGVDPLELEPLYNVVDPDALNDLFRSAGTRPSTSLELRFSMADCEVVVRGDGEVAVTPPAENDEGPTTVTLREE